MLRKTIDVPITKAPTDGSGVGSGIVSTFGPPADTYGDIIAWGAFHEGLDWWIARGEWPPLLWQHNDSTPENVVGTITDMRETAAGLVIDFKLNLKNPRAVALYESVLTGAIGQFSIGFTLEDEDRVDNGDGTWTIKKLELIEISFVVAGANRNTRVVSIKSAEGRPTTVTRRSTPVRPISDNERDTYELARTAVSLHRKAKGIGFDQEPVEGSYEDAQEDLVEALTTAEGTGYMVTIIATFADHVVYSLLTRNSNGDVNWDGEAEAFSRPYTYDEATDSITFGDRTAVDIVTTVEGPDTDLKLRPKVRTRRSEISLARFRANKLAQYGDSDETRTALGLPTKAEEAAAATAARIAEMAKRPQPSGRTTVTVDARMRPIVEQAVPDEGPLVR